jgi:hypothetical protein
MLVVLGSFFLWARFLVVLGVLSKEEAKGYPYAKPWEKDQELSPTVKL